MKKLFFSFFSLLMVVSFSLDAQVNYKIHETGYKKIHISFSFGALQTIEVKAEEASFTRIFIEGCVGSNNIGEPELPVSVSTLQIPICGDYEINVFGKDFVIYDAKELGLNYPVFPAQPSVSKSHEGPVEFVQNKNIYQADAFYSLPLARFEKSGMMRNVNLGQLYVSPVQYNPVTHEIKIYKTIDVEILFKKIEFVKTQIIKDLHNSPLFRQTNIINPIKNDRVEFSSTPIKYLIVAHAMFRGELDQFISWKKRKGFLVEIGYTDDENVGATRDSIQNFIRTFYNNATLESPAPTYVLLVGDVQQIPVFYGSPGSHPTDLYYFTWADDNFPCCYYGRFSAQNIAQLIPQIEKTLQYEQFTMPNANYLNNIVLVAGFDNTYAPTYGNGFVNYVDTYYATANYGYSDVFAHLHPCDKFAVQIRQEIGAGVGIANYTAHCSSSGWDSPAFKVNHIDAMNNSNKYGLMIGNCCESSRFSVSECFAEALLRAPGKGAVGYIGAANLSYWDEDYYWGIGLRAPCTANPTYDPANLGAYDRLFHTHGETNDSWMTTFGSMMIAGNEAVQTSTSTLRKYYWEIYNLMGDPSIMTYLTKPSPMNVELADRLNIRDTSLSAKVAPYSYCALTNSEQQLLSAGFADAAGNITLLFDTISAGNYEFAAWAQNHIQYFKTIKCGENYINEKRISCNIFPNPTTGEFSIQVAGWTSGQVNNVEIYDVYGRKQKAEGRKEKEEWRTDIAHLSAGIYFVKITTKKGIITKKVIKY
jgi:hypothetical protein